MDKFKTKGSSNMSKSKQKVKNRKVHPLQMQVQEGIPKQEHTQYTQKLDNNETKER